MDNFTPFEQESGYALAEFILKNIWRVVGIFLDLNSHDLNIEQFLSVFKNIFRHYSPAVHETIALLENGEILHEMNRFLGDLFRFHSMNNGKVIHVEISSELMELGRNDDFNTIRAVADHQLEQLREMYHGRTELPPPPSPESDIPDYQSEFALNLCGVKTGPERRTGGVSKSRGKSSPIVGQQRSQRTSHQPNYGEVPRVNEPSTSSSSSESSRHDPRSRSSQPTSSGAMESRTWENRSRRSSPPINRYRDYSSGSSRGRDERRDRRPSGRNPTTSNHMYQSSQQGSSSHISSSVPSRGGYSGGFSNMRHSQDLRDLRNSGQTPLREEAQRYPSSQRTSHQPNYGAVPRANEPSTSSSSSESSRYDPRSRSSQPTSSGAIGSRTWANRTRRSSPPINQYHNYSGGSSHYQDERRDRRSSGRSPSTSNPMYQSSQQGSSSQFPSSLPSRGGYSGGFSNMRSSKDQRDKRNSGGKPAREETQRYRNSLYEEPGTSYSSSETRDDFNPFPQPAPQHRPHESSSEYRRLHRSPHRFNRSQASREPQFRSTDSASWDNRNRRTDRRESWSGSTDRSLFVSRDESSLSQTPASSRRQSSDEPSSVYFTASDFGNSEDRRESSAYNSDANPREDSSLHLPRALSSHAPRNPRDSDEFSSMDEAFIQENDSDRRSNDVNSMSRRRMERNDAVEEISEKLKLAGLDDSKPPSFGHSLNTRDSSARSSGANQTSRPSLNPNAPIFPPQTTHSSHSTTSSLFSGSETVISYRTHTVTLRHDGPNIPPAGYSVESTRPEEREIGKCERCKHMMCHSEVLVRCTYCKRVQCRQNHGNVNPKSGSCFYCDARFD